MALLLHRPADELDALMDESAWPPEVDLILSALDTAAQLRPSTTPNKRKSPRRPHRVLAEISLYCDSFNHAPWLIYTRDTTPSHIGFLSHRPIPLGQSGTVRWHDPRGNLHTATCTVSRCRETVRDWYEGALNLHPD